MCNNDNLIFTCYENMIVQIDEGICCLKLRSGPETFVIITYLAVMNSTLGVFWDVLGHQIKRILMRF